MLSSRTYAHQLEDKLIQDFSNIFYNKLGYYPLVVTRQQNKRHFPFVKITLEQLEHAITPFAPRDAVTRRRMSVKHRSKMRDINIIRSIFCYIASMIGYSTTEIGAYLMGRDHSSVTAAIQAFNDSMQTSHRFRDTYYSILNYIKDLYYEPPTMDYTNPSRPESQPAVLAGLLPLQD